MAYTPRDTGEFVRAAGKGSNERNHGARKKWDQVNWRSSGPITGFKKTGVKEKKVYGLLH